MKNQKDRIFCLEQAVSQFEGAVVSLKAAKAIIMGIASTTGSVQFIATAIKSTRFAEAMVVGWLDQEEQHPEGKEPPPRCPHGNINQKGLGRCSDCDS